MSTEPDPAPSEFEILVQRLREMAQQPVPGNSDTIDIEQLLKQLLPVDTEVGETEQPTSETEEVDDRASGNGLIRGGGLVTRISDNKEPQFDNNRKYRDRPVRKKDTMTHGNYNTPVPRNTDSDESDSDEMLPIGAFLARTRG